MNVDVQKTERRGWFRRRRGDHVEERTLTPDTVPPVMLSSDPGSPAIGPTNALAIADAYACVRVLSDAAASLPLIPYRRTATGRERYSGLIADLLTRPAPATTQANLVGQLVAHLNLHGNAYLGKFRGPDGKIEQLGLLAPDRVVPQLNAGVPYYRYSPLIGEQQLLTTRDVIHVRALSTNGLSGLSPVRQCRSALGLAQNLATHASVFFENDARPSGILKIEDGSNQGEALRGLRESWDTRLGGVQNAHKIAVLSGDVSFTPLSMPLEDAQFLGQRELSTREIARIFRIPPWMIGATDGNRMTYSNTEQQALSFVIYSLRPWLVLIEQALTADPDLSPAGVYIEFLIDALLRGDSQTRAQVYAQALNPVSGWMTREEVRRLENLDPEDDRPTPAATVPSQNGATVA